ncbi:hypothetical protein [Ureaplasma diversum]|uniref:Uncharacterized protein n=1 Tax=Ureaplasma diversum NCTC 246 TaxID=1188241 RepID=A0A084F1C4_9BACT|nr:hypothetical protein [Ureaplasma diversum]KEZ24016.1 Hypothetical protein, predicted lipoprotein [Ureaplasma diversum NCTC 246]
MSKFKNKKALTLAVGAIMAGVSVIGVVAACAPTKAKPSNPSQGTQNPSQGTQNPSQSGGTESTNPGSGNTTNPSGQGSENNTTNPSSGSTNTNPGATNPESGIKQEDPMTTNPSKQAQPEDPKNSGGDTNSKGEEKTEGNSPSVGSGSNEEMKDNKTPNLGSKPSEDSISSDQKGEKDGNTNNRNPSETQKVDPSSPGSAEKPDMQADSPKENGDSSNGQNDGKKKTEAPQDPNTESTLPQTGETVKPVAVNLEDNVKLTENNVDFVLPLKFENADGKFVDVELLEVNGSKDPIKSNSRVEIKDNSAIVSFSNINLISKYKVKTIKLFETSKPEDEKFVDVSEKVNDREISVDSKVLKLVQYQRLPDGWPQIVLEVSTKLYSQFDGKKFGFSIENNAKGTDSTTHFATKPNDSTPIWTEIVKQGNGKTSFLIFTDFPYPNEKGNGNWYIKSLWFNTDTQKNNLLKDTIEFKS